MKLILLRGLPGSGKTSLIKDLGKKAHDDNKSIATQSTDNYFMWDEENGRVYRFDATKLNKYHQYCFEACISSFENRRDIVIVDNTNITFKEMQRYILAALAFGYEVEFLEPDTAWKYDVEECARRNTHQVPLASIQNMSKRWESTEVCISKLNKLIETVQSLNQRN